MEPMALIGVLLKEGAPAFPAVAVVVLWFKLQQMEKRLAALIDQYVSLIQDATRHITENTSALKGLRCNGRD